jgi:ribose transport system permease protein
MIRHWKNTWLGLLNHLPLILFLGVVVVFGALAPKFRETQNWLNILLQSASTTIVAVGMTFVLLTAGVDLSVGAIMFVGAAVAGKLALSGVPFGLCLLTMLAIGGVFGGLNAWLITRLRVIAFIATLATLYLGRGLALWITQTRAMNLPDAFLQLGSAQLTIPYPAASELGNHWLGGASLKLSVPVLIAAGVLLLAHLVLTRTPFGRQLYAVGHDADAARKAGLNTGWILAAVYVICGICAALGGIVSLSQLGAVSPTFGQQKEFTAIAAAVLGGTSLFGGRGQVFPGTVIGAVLIQTVENGLVILNADPYLYPLITSSIIFLAVLLDSTRHWLLARLSRRKIRLET